MTSKLTALVVDYGGVLTNSLRETMGSWMAAERIDPERFAATMREWLAGGAEANIAHELERGAISPAEFERRFVRLLVREDGSEIGAVRGHHAGVAGRRRRGQHRARVGAGGDQPGGVRAAVRPAAGA